MSNWEQKLLNEVRDDVKTILSQLPHLATKEELEKTNDETRAIRKEINRYKTILNTVGIGFAFVWGLIKGLPTAIEHWTGLIK